MPAAARSASRFSDPIIRAARRRAASSSRRGSKHIGSRSGSVLENGDDLALLDELVLGDQHLANGASLLDVVRHGKVRLADREVDDLVAVNFELARVPIPGIAAVPARDRSLDSL